MACYYFYFPPLAKLSGGMRVIAGLACELAQTGRDARLVLQKEAPQISGWLQRRYPVLPCIRWDKLELASEDWWIIPESWPLALQPGLQAGCNCVVYAQSWIYVHGLLPDGVSWQDLPVRFWAVSAPVASFLKETTGFAAPIVPPAIDPEIFYPPAVSDMPQTAIAWMPRKNRALAVQARAILAAIRRKNGASQPSWIEIDGKSSQDVAALLRASGIFFATGFPEGCPLPPLEAMSCGCIVCGFTGFGGWDYMRQGMPRGFAPALELSPRPWGPNGFYTADADVFGAAQALDYALKISGAPEADVIRANARATAAAYSRQAQRDALLQALRQ